MNTLARTTKVEFRCWIRFLCCQGAGTIFHGGLFIDSSI